MFVMKVFSVIHNQVKYKAFFHANFLRDQTICQGDNSIMLINVMHCQDCTKLHI